MREVSMTNYNLQRFLDAQRGDYEQALAEVRNPANQEWYPTSDSTLADANASQSPTYPVHDLPNSSIKLQ